MPLKRPTTTPLPDDIYDEWAPLLGEAELKVLLYIVRRTLGFRKEADAISLTQFTGGIVARDGRVLDRGCGVMSRRHVIRALASLEDKGLIRATRGRNQSGGRAVTVYALWWEGGPNEAECRGSGRRTPGGAQGIPGWYPSMTEVGAQGHQGSARETPTTNSRPTNRQQNSGTTARTSVDTAPREQDTGAAHLWHAVLGDLCTTMTAGNYAAWLANTWAAACDEDTLRVSVPALAQQRWLETRLRRRIEDSLRRLGHDGVRVVFVVAP